VPEGDTIFRTARLLHRTLTGHVVTRFESVYPALTRVDEDRRIAGRTIDAATARGKHLLIAFSDDLVLHTHLRMHGRWDVYGADERWRRPRSEMRVVLATDTVVAVGFNIPVAEFLTARDLQRHAQLRALGPDLLSADFDAADVLRRMDGHPRTAIADLLLNQQVVCGIGNVFKSEILFVAGVDPFARTAALDPSTLARIVEVARRLLRESVLEPRSTLSRAAGRRTTRSLDPRESLWVYGRAGRPCRRCGTPIEVRKTGPDARLTYWCPRCQG
jgi:endonuclease-8